MKKVTRLFCGIGVVCAMFLVGPSLAQTKMKMPEKAVAPSSLILKADMRQLWEDHSLWTRNVILCLVDGLPGMEQAKARLMKNQADIGNSIKPYYGADAANKLTGLLEAHIKIAVDVVNSAKNENTYALNEAKIKWATNADEIAVFLSNANPNLPVADLKKMMSEHLQLTADEAMKRIEKDYDADVVAYDKVRKELIEMSDMISAAIAKQFPEKFKIVASK